MSKDDSNLKALRKAQVVELATAQIPTIAGHLKEFGADNDIPAAAYIATLPEGVDSAAAAAIHRHDTVFLGASGKAAQDASVAFMAKKANKDVQAVTTTFDMLGGVTATHYVKRSEERREMTDADGKVIAPASTVFGSAVSRIKFPVSGTKELLKQSLEANAKLLG